MSHGIDRWFKWIWFVNGLLALLALLVGIGWALVAFMSGPGNEGIAVAGPEAVDSASLQPRAVRLGTPADIRGSDTRLIRVWHGRGSYPSEATMRTARSSYVGSGGYYGQGPLVNLIFLRSAGESGLLFRKPALVESIDYPQPAADADAGQSWIAITAVLEDTNANGRLDRDDRHDLYLTDLDGSSLRRVLTDSFTVQSVMRLENPERVLVYALDASSSLEPEDRPLRVFIVNPQTGVTGSDSAINALAEEAGRIVGK